MVKLTPTERHELACRRVLEALKEEVLRVGLTGPHGFFQPTGGMVVFVRGALEQLYPDGTIMPRDVRVVIDGLINDGYLIRRSGASSHYQIVARDDLPFNAEAPGTPQDVMATVDELLAYHRANGTLLEWFGALLLAIAQSGDLYGLTLVQVSNLLRRAAAVEYVLIDQLREF